MLKWNLPLIVPHFTAKREADKSSVCSIPEIMEIFPDEKLKHIKEKRKMNNVHPVLRSIHHYIQQHKYLKKGYSLLAYFSCYCFHDHRYFSLNCCGLNTKATLNAGLSYSFTSVCLALMYGVRAIFLSLPQWTLCYLLHIQLFVPEYAFWLVLVSFIAVLRAYITVKT